MIIKNHVSSRPYNSFNIEVEFSTLIELENKGDFQNIQELAHGEYKILGGGSNILLTRDIDYPVFHIKNRGIEVLIEEEEYVLLSVSAGENWHDVVLWSMEQNLGGIENLSLIPGNAGTAPIQNIGAYGVELKDVLHALRAYNIKNGLEYTFHNKECTFEYRSSIFKQELKGQFIISEIILKLTKKGFHLINTSYGDIKNRLGEMHITEASIQDVSNAVISIRQSKLPDPKVIGNAGSFFKNPIVHVELLKELKTKYSSIPHYPVSETKVKLPAGWMIEQCGWKGKMYGHTGTYKNQALVIINDGQATGQEVYELSLKILESVEKEFGIQLEREVNIW